MKKIVVFCLMPKEINFKAIESENLEIKKWTPSLFSLIPPNSGISYVIFWIAHYLRIFKNRFYCAYQIMEDNQVISSLVCVPSTFIWHFMKGNDLQIKKVYTHPNFRGKGLALNLIDTVIKECYMKNRVFWYMTHDQNHASLRVIKKADFKFKGYYYKKKRKFLVIKTGDICDA